MQHLPEVLKIVEGALQRDVTKVARYTEFLANKLEEEGDTSSSNHLRKAMKNVAQRSLRPAEIATKHRVPVDEESRVALADISHPNQDEISLVLEDHVVEALSDFVRSYERRDELLSAGLAGPGHILLYGPPGCGKTQTATFLAASLKLPLVTARLDGLISSFLGSTAKNIRYLFEFVDKAPCVFLLDEFDAVAKMRDDPHELGELKRVVNSLLQNIDFLPEGTVVVAATNHEHLLDPAVWRRFELHIEIATPDGEARRKLLQLFTKDLADDELEVLSAVTQGLSGADIRSAAEFMARQRILNGDGDDRLARMIEHVLRFKAGPEALGHGRGNPWPQQLDERIALLREINPTVFTYAVISRVLRVSKGKISKILSRKGSADG